MHVRRGACTQSCMCAEVHVRRVACTQTPQPLPLPSNFPSTQQVCQYFCSLPLTCRTAAKRATAMRARWLSGVTDDGHKLRRGSHSTLGCEVRAWSAGGECRPLLVGNPTATANAGPPRRRGKRNRLHHEPSSASMLACDCRHSLRRVQHSTTQRFADKHGWNQVHNEFHNSWPHKRKLRKAAAVQTRAL
jgi:hypothetical protein